MTAPLLHLNVAGDLALRPLRERDAAAFFALVERNRAHLRPWLGWVDRVGSLDDARDLIRLFMDYEEAGTGTSGGLRLDGSLIGVFDLHDLDRKHGNVGLGYWIDASFEGQGLVTRTIEAVLRQLFEEQGLHRAEIRCTPTNTRSRAVAERLGFMLEGRLRQARLVNGRHHDLVVYGLLAEEWHRRMDV